MVLRASINVLCTAENEDEIKLLDKSYGTWNNGISQDFLERTWTAEDVSLTIITFSCQSDHEASITNKQHYLVSTTTPCNGVNSYN